MFLESQTLKTSYFTMFLHQNDSKIDLKAALGRPTLAPLGALGGHVGSWRPPLLGKIIARCFNIAPREAPVFENAENLISDDHFR